MRGLGQCVKNTAAKTPVASPIRRRLIGLALWPLGLILPILLFALSHWGNAYVERLLIAKVGTELGVAEVHFAKTRSEMSDALTGLAASWRLAQRLEMPGDGLKTWLAQEKTHLALDFLHFIPLNHCPAPPLPTACFGEWPVIEAARNGQSGHALEVFSAQILAAFDPALAARAHIPLLPTANAAPDSRRAEARGLVIHAAAPVYDAAGVLRGVLAGGVLLNGNLAYIDRLNAAVYPEGDSPFESPGTATLFLGDVRIATNVRLFAGERAIGTRVSKEVREQVLVGGQTWRDRAFVVRDWYYSAYRPLTDSRGERVGMLYVGFLEAPFAAAKRTAWVALALFFLLAMGLAAVLAIFWARRISGPIERMHTTMHALEQGESGSRVGPLSSADELGDLARHFDQLLDTQAAHTRMLEARSADLDQQVAARTGELQQALADLHAAQRSLIHNEKMAAIGQLTAGVAHEINNPVAVIQGNLELAREVLGEAGAPVKEEFHLILQQVQRIRLIVTKLLQFARPQEYVGYLEPVDAGQLIHDCLLLVGHHLKKGNIAIAQEINSKRSVHGNKSELQQVLINLLVNAIEAMPEGGLLQLSIDDWDSADMPIGIRLRVSDSGPGIAVSERERLFQPFHTAHKTGGHGLGLWVSQTLLERYDARITLDDSPQGACFSMWLRCEVLG